MVSSYIGMYLLANFPLLSKVPPKKEKMKNKKGKTGEKIYNRNNGGKMRAERKKKCTERTERADFLFLTEVSAYSLCEYAHNLVLWAKSRWVESTFG